MRDDIILLGHGSGGKLTHNLLDEIIIPILSGVEQSEQNDAAILPQPEGRLAFTTDSYVVDPIIFAGGNIGDLSINGTVNDLAMAGARPLYISVGLILEEGLEIATLKTILQSMKDAAEKANVRIVTGDTKVVPRGKGDKIFINTAGVGVIEHDLRITGDNAQVGDKVIINGSIGDHGMAVLADREGLNLGNSIETDSAALNGMVDALVKNIGESLHVLRDPTRGGVATTIKEIAQQSAVEIQLDEQSLPIHQEVGGACSILGLDPLFVANEGKLLVFVAPEKAEEALALMKKQDTGSEATIIGEVVEGKSGRVSMRTAIGGMRSIEMLSGEQLPRIC